MRVRARRNLFRSITVTRLVQRYVYVSTTRFSLPNPILPARVRPLRAQLPFQTILCAVFFSLRHPPPSHQAVVVSPELRKIDGTANWFCQSGRDERKWREWGRSLTETAGARLTSAGKIRYGTTVTNALQLPLNRASSFHAPTNDDSRSIVCNHGVCAPLLSRHYYI